ncbi:SDR family NAD(P)-dependent oxidoreductase [Paenibacillus hodogayensis]|uniref:SDR family NAD(P)-dependent oxidoreductase n=1 Tax=Paenibacillus hodogayensis TaxID=279208 RepID=A0ABV5VZ43_9BACL
MKLHGKKVLITGAAQGIGQGIAEKFAAEGAELYLLDVRAAELQETAEALLDRGAARVEHAVCDLSDLDAALAAAEQAWSTMGAIDVLINNAGIAFREPFSGISLDRWTKVMDVNVNAMFVLSQAIVNRMTERGQGGSIVNMTSKNGLAGSSMLAHYNASKGAVVLLTQSMAVELAPHGIRVNAVAPGFIDTPLDRKLKQQDSSLNLTARTPMGRTGTVEEVANAFLFLASEDASYITGVTLPVDGGHLANAGEL